MTNTYRWQYYHGGRARDQALLMDKEPEHYLWEASATRTLVDLSELLGIQDYERFIDLVWPNESHNDWSWRRIFYAGHRALSAARDGERDVERLAEIAKGPVGTRRE